MEYDLLLHQEVLLLALNDDKGTLSSGMIQYAIGGAMVSELLLLERIVVNDDKKQMVAVIDDTPIGEIVLDELLTLVVESPKNLGLQDWVFKAASMKNLHHRVAESLCSKGILKHDQRKILFLFSQNVYPELNGTFEDAIRRRMAAVMFDDSAQPDVRTAVLIALASHATLLDQNFAPVELKQHKHRIKELATGEILAAGATRAAIQAVETAIIVATMVPVIVATTSSS